MSCVFEFPGVFGRYIDVVRVDEDEANGRFYAVTRDGQRLASASYVPADYADAVQRFVAAWSAALENRSGTDVVLQVKKLRPEARLPVRSSPGASCFDVHAIDGGVLEPGRRALVKTGLQMAVPHGYEIQVRSRSGHAAKAGVFVLNSPGTVDSDYRGEVGVILQNSGAAPFNYAPGDRIAQIAVCAVEMCESREVESLTDTQRGAGGFGSTGVR